MNYKFTVKRSRKIPKYYSVKFNVLLKSFLLISVIQKIMMIIFKNWLIGRLSEIGDNNNQTSLFCTASFPLNKGNLLARSEL